MDQQNLPQKSQAGKYLKTYLGVIGIVGIFTAGIFIGRTTQVTRFLSHADQNSISPTVQTDSSIKHVSKDPSFDQYWDVWDIIKKDALKKEISDKDLFYSSLEGMVYALNDPYSMYFKPEAAEEFGRDLQRVC